jgi:hypothetical protein
MELCRNALERSNRRRRPACECSRDGWMITAAAEGSDLKRTLGAQVRVADTALR